jgi:hypothetical protein
MRCDGIRITRKIRKKVPFLPANPQRAKTRLVPGKAAAWSATRRIVSVTSADGPEVHDALNKARHVCERRRDVRRPCPGERPVSPTNPTRAVAAERCENALGDFFRILLVNGSITLA